jgi:hypothetical protein
LTRADEHDVWQLERVLKLHDHLLGPACRILDTFLALLVTQLPQQQERHEDERDGQQDVWLDHMQEMEDERDRSRHNARHGIPIVSTEPMLHAALLHGLPLPRHVKRLPESPRGAPSNPATDFRREPAVRRAQAL